MSTVYRFRMLSDENDNFVRDIEVPADASLLDMHDFIIRMLGYDPCITSFFTADGEWQPLREYTSMDTGMETDGGHPMPSAPMAGTTIAEVAGNEHDRLIYLFDNLNQRAYYLEMIEQKSPQKGMTYPRVQFEHSPAPDQYDPEANEQSGSIFDEMMGDYNDFDGDDNYDDEY